MKQDLDKISSLVSTDPHYEKVKQRLNFEESSTSVSSRSISSKKRALKLIIPVSALCNVAAVLISILIPTFKNRHHSSLQPISDELMSFYIDSVSNKSIDADLATPYSVNLFYDYYQENVNDLHILIMNRALINLEVENQYLCYYVKKDVLDAVEWHFEHGPFQDDCSLPWRKLTAYFEGCLYGFYLDEQKNNELNNSKIMELIVGVDDKVIQSQIGDYYLLDIVRYYKDTNYNDDHYFIDFVDYDILNNEVLIDTIKSKELLEYCFFKYDPIYRYTGKFSYLYAFENCAWNIEKDDVHEVVNELFCYQGLKSETNENYYNELNECIIRKTYIETQTRLYGGRYYDDVLYEITFDFNKLIELFSVEWCA